MHGMLASAWRYRYFISSSIQTELRIKFIRSRLGGLWMILNPLAQVLIFAFVLSTVMASRLPGMNQRFAYPVYLMAGTLGWSLFSEIITRCLTLFIDNGNTLKKLAFPRIALPLVVTGSALVNNVLLFGAVLLIFGLLGHWPGAALAWLPLLTLITVAFALGVGLALGVLNVFMRDIGQIVPVLLQFGYWFTPVVYTVNIIPERFRGALVLNPLIPLITGYQDALLFNRTPDLLGLARTALLAAFLLALAMLLFRKASPEMVDQL